MGVALNKGIVFFGKCPVGPPLVFALTLGVTAVCPSECQHLARGHPLPVGHVPAMTSDAEVALGLCCMLCAQGAAAQPWCPTGTHLVQLQEGASIAEGLDSWFDFLPHSWVLLSIDFLSVKEPRK